MKALILAAGYATRLYPLTKEYPKPLLKVDDRPIIDYILEKLDALSQIKEIIVITNSKFIPFFKEWQKSLKISKPVTLIDDLTRTHEDKLGAIGDMNFAITRGHIKDDLLVIGGDNLFDGDLSEFLSFAKKSKGSPVIGIYDIKDRHKATHYGIISLDEQDKIVEFSEKPKHPKTSLVAMCLYYFPKEKLKLLKEYLGVKAGKHDATGFYIDWLSKKIPVYGFKFDCRWFDIGEYESYGKAKKSFAV